MRRVCVVLDPLSIVPIVCSWFPLRFAFDVLAFVLPLLAAALCLPLPGLPFFLIN